MALMTSEKLADLLRDAAEIRLIEPPVGRCARFEYQGLHEAKEAGPPREVETGSSPILVNRKPQPDSKRLVLNNELYCTPI